MLDRETYNVQALIYDLQDCNPNSLVTCVDIHAHISTLCAADIKVSYINAERDDEIRTFVLLLPDDDKPKLTVQDLITELSKYDDNMYVIDGVYGHDISNIQRDDDEIYIY